MFTNEVAIDSSSVAVTAFRYRACLEEGVSSHLGNYICDRHVFDKIKAHNLEAFVVKSVANFICLSNTSST